MFDRNVHCAADRMAGNAGVRRAHCSTTVPSSAREAIDSLHRTQQFFDRFYESSLRVK
jgi:hypothetical protein